MFYHLESWGFFVVSEFSTVTLSKNATKHILQQKTRQMSRHIDWYNIQNTTLNSPGTAERILFRWSTKFFYFIQSQNFLLQYSSSTYFRGGVSFQIIIIRKFQILLNVGIYCDKTFMHYQTSPKYYML